MSLPKLWGLLRILTAGLPPWIHLALGGVGSVPSELDKGRYLYLIPFRSVPFLLPNSHLS